MAGFNFEQDLPHQTEAVESIVNVFKGLNIQQEANIAMQKVCNPKFQLQTLKYPQNIDAVQKHQGIFKTDCRILDMKSNVLDVSMETGTGKTYAYTKAMFELHRTYGIWKFIVVVPTLSIKAGTVSFLRSSATKMHFKDIYHKALKVHVVESQKSKGKEKKSYMPQAATAFVEANHAETIHVLVINAGMINSPTMKTVFDRQLFDTYDTAFSAIASVKPFTIVDEPHKFPTRKVTWDNVQQLGSQCILRFGATFNHDYKNLIHELTAVDAFNQDLVKGVVTYVEAFDEGNNISIKLLRLYRDEVKDSGRPKKILEAVFELNNNGKTKRVKLIKGESLEKIHPAMQALTIEKHNQKLVVLSNGLELIVGSVINPYSYAESLQDKMISNAVRRHFEIEKDLLTREVKIKPITLFFIDDIEGYRADHQISGSLKKKFEALVEAQAKALLKKETNPFYQAYLEKTLQDLSLTHGGYFSKDNTGSDDKVEQEITEILHDKETLLSLENPRRFIFSKWTLREGWDNPNVFQIWKLRSSGSQTSKLQEVGRGLRLPVNQYMSRVKDEQFELHYYVDFTEQDFANALVNEINSKSNVIAASPTSLTPELIAQIERAYSGIKEDDILEALDEAGAITRSNAFKQGGFAKLQELYPFISVGTGLKANKVRSGDVKKQKATLRVAKYNELKALWEAINQRVVLEYKIDSENDFKSILLSYFKTCKNDFKAQGSVTRHAKIEFTKEAAFAVEEDSLDHDILPLVTMSYKDFLIALGRDLHVNINTLHQVFLDIQKDLDINAYLSYPTIRTIKGGFKKHLLEHAFGKYQIAYNKVSNCIHPTVFTNAKGVPHQAVSAANLGTQQDVLKKTAKQYLFEEVFYDSSLERENMITSIKEVIVFTKIPKNSIRIPVAGGGTYSPDFAYVVEYEDGQKTLNLIVESKDTDKASLRNEEKQKIKHAEALFNSFEHGFKVSFEAQFKSQKIKEVIQETLKIDSPK
ncbi:MAG: type III restriction-modification system endonuclease [Mariprofundaceae bacterium]|nr:type III restriction-modification system endonuclease [Mariprofundaceae bacterium]